MLSTKIKKRIHDIIVNNNLVLEKNDAETNRLNVFNNISFIQEKLKRDIPHGGSRMKKNYVKNLILDVLGNVIPLDVPPVRGENRRKEKLQRREKLHSKEILCMTMDPSKEEIEEDDASERGMKNLYEDEARDTCEETLGNVKKRTTGNKDMGNKEMGNKEMGNKEKGNKEKGKKEEGKVRGLTEWRKCDESKNDGSEQKRKIITTPFGHKNMVINPSIGKIKKRELWNIHGKKTKMDDMYKTEKGEEEKNNDVSNVLKNIKKCINKDINLRNYKGINNLKKDILYSIIYPYIYRNNNFSTIVNINGINGSGKTTLSYAIAGECNCPFFYLNLPEYMKYLPSESKNNKLKIIFEHIKNEYNKCILCIDDVDVIFSQKDDSVDLYLFTYLLSIFDNSNVVILLLSVNKPCDTILYTKIKKFISLPIPTYEDRVEILQNLSHEFLIHFNIPYAASITYGFNRGQLCDIVNESLNLFLYSKVIGEQNENQDGVDVVGHISNYSHFQCCLCYGKHDTDTIDNTCGGINANCCHGREKVEKPIDSHDFMKNIPIDMPTIEMSTGDSNSNERNNMETVELIEEKILHSAVNSEQLGSNKEKGENSGNSTTSFLFHTKEYTHVETEKGMKRSNSHMDVVNSHVSSIEKRIKKSKYVNISNDIIYDSVKNIKKKMTTQNICEVPNVHLDNVGSLENIKKVLETKFILPVKYANIYKHLGINKSMGILLYGPPGCGKTMLAKAISNEMKANFIAIKGPEILNKYVGESEKKVREIFSYASIYKPCLIFFDEIDSICINRDNSKNSAASDRVVNQLLTEMDGLSQRESVYIIATTNRPDIIDKALLRSGRFDQLIYISLPKYQGRIDILKKLSKNMPIDKDVNFSVISRLTKGYSGADLYGVLRESAFIALQECRDKIHTINSDISAWESTTDGKTTYHHSSTLNSANISKDEKKIKKGNTIVDNVITIPCTGIGAKDMYVKRDHFNSCSDVSNNILKHPNCITTFDQGGMEEKNGTIDVSMVDCNSSIFLNKKNVCKIEEKTGADNNKTLRMDALSGQNSHNDLPLFQCRLNTPEEKKSLKLCSHKNELPKSRKTGKKSKEKKTGKKSKEKKTGKKSKGKKTYLSKFIDSKEEHNIQCSHNSGSTMNGNLTFKIEDLKNEDLDEKDKNNLIYEYIQKNKNILTIKQKHIMLAIDIVPRSVTREQMRYYKEISKKFK
ncbi:ATPase, putative [Plasmodium ovale]|uniref:ATPase, putative n=1 Tax=Plasmodium ovale TaxID=36330 RepID=A0A1C3L4Y8_PLAOA|nr:ATPase, putative [Plasmodium ovale]